LILEGEKKYIFEIVVILMIYKEFFRDAYKIKENKNDIRFFPQITKPGKPGVREDLSYEEIANKSCDGFAQIAMDKKYNYLINLHEMAWWLNNCFYRDRSQLNKMIEENKNKPSSDPKLVRVQELLNEGYSISPEDYFQLTNMLFSFS